MLTVRSLRAALVLILAGSVAAAAQKKPAGTMSLSAVPPIESPGQDIQGMRPESVGAVARFSLSLDTASNLRSRSNAARRLQIALPDGKAVTCLLRPVSRPDTMVVFAGSTVGGEPGDRCNLVLHGGQVTGEIDITGGRYRIQPVGPGDAHAIVEIKTEALPNELEAKRPSGEESPRGLTPPGDNTQLCDVKPPPGQPPKTFGPLRVMILYTPAVTAASPNIRADIELIVQQIRTAYSAARLGGNFSVSVELAHAQELNYVENDDMEKDLDRLTDPRDVTFRPVHALRDTHKADVVHMLTKAKQRGACGIGWLNLSLRPQHAFSVSDHQCALQVFSAVHEIGHNIGMNHDRFVERSGKPGPAEFNFGFVSLQRGTRSLMSYNNQCAEQKKSCLRLLQLSSPNVRVGGVAYGFPIEHAEAAYNVEVLCRNAATVARFR